jgi:penicillin amidase
MNKIVKVILGILIILLPALVVLGLLFRGLSHKSFYPVNVSGISSDVKIYFDDYGVPHILASNESDMYFSLGYMHARDRLWQMDLMRRVAEGRLSEILGSAVLDYDKLFRTVGINNTAYKLYENASPKSREILMAYSNGVNKFIETHINELPAEFDILNYKPDQWKPEHSLMIGRLMGWELNIAWYTDYVMGEIINKVGIEKTSVIFPDTSITLFKKIKIEADSLSDTTKKISELENNFKSIAALGNSFFSINESYRKFFGINNSHSGSNSWVISGDKSESGKPILANDPHLAFMAPSKWYEAHIKGGNVDVTGMTLPGVPAVIIGHNNSIAWGMTNLMNDDNDFIILEQDSTDNSRYRYKNQLVKIDSITERIPVKDSAEAELTVKYTQLGVVISDLNKHGFIMDRHSKNKLMTFKWTGSEITDDFLSFYKLNTAKNWDDFRNGLKDFCCPAQNFIYADTAGNIGYHAAGKIPIRKSDNFEGKIYPSASLEDWTGFIDFDKMPNAFNPKEGYIVTANTNPWDWLKTESKDKYYISYFWEPSSRFDAISEVLKGSAKFNPDEFKLLQMNLRSPFAKIISSYLTEAYKDVKNPDAVTSVALDKFKYWNGEMLHNEPVGAIYNVFFVYLVKNIYHDELGDDVFTDFLTIGSFPYNSTLKLLKENEEESGVWFDNINSPAKETKNEILRKSFNEALNYLKQRFKSDDVNTWRWGELHKLKFMHILGTAAALDPTFNIGPYEIGGDQTTINNSEYNLNKAYKDGKFDDILGPSMRMITDMADVKHSLSVNSTGQSGQPIHPNYQDQTRMWIYGEYKRMVMDEFEMINKRYRLVTLTPIK